MRRQDKYPDTATYHYYNANPKNRITGDCVVRALTVALEKPYDEILMELVDIQLTQGYSATSKEAYSRLLANHGWEKQKQPRKIDNTKYTGKEFCEAQQNKTEFVDNIIFSDRIFAHVGGNHVAAIINGKVWDIWNSTGDCIGNYWVKG